jgi:hypothetical protein
MKYRPSEEEKYNKAVICICFDILKINILLFGFKIVIKEEMTVDLQVCYNLSVNQ